MKLPEIARATVPSARHDVVGIRPGEKLHEQMIGAEDAPHTYEYDSHFKILPAIHNWSNDTKRNHGGKLVASDFTYCSDNNPNWMSPDSLRAWIEQNRAKIGKI